MDPCGANFSTANCPQQCLDPITAFQPQNVYACMDAMYVGLSQIARNVIPWNPVVDILDACMTQYCDFADLTVGGCPYYGLSLELSTGALARQRYGFTERWLCKNVDNRVNPDIGGIGVVVSYLLQACISILLFLTIRLIAFLNSWLKTASRMGPSLKSKLMGQEVVLKAIVVEFQEAQCFFMLACQTAVFAIINALAKDPKFLGTQTMSALKYNLAMARLVCLGGIVPVAFVLYIIHTVDKSSLVICALSGFTIALSMGALFAIPTDLSPAFLNPLPYQAKLDKCGKNAPPVVFCLGMPVSNRELDIMIVICCAAVCLIISSSCIRSYVESLAGRSDETKRNKALSFIARICERLGEIASGQRYMLRFWDIPLILSFVVYCLQFRTFLADGVIDATAWSFGQIVAVAVWFQVIMKYMYWSAFGIGGCSADGTLAENKMLGNESSLQERHAENGEGINHHKCLPCYKQDQNDEEEEYSAL